VLAATYHQVWRPDASVIKYDLGHLPVWDEGVGGYLDPATGEVLPTWDQALDAIGPDDEPWHVARFGVRFDAQGVLARSKDAARCIGYLTKYLTKQVSDCHQADTDPQRAHAARLAEALRFQPCSPTCANWLRYGIQPKNARPGLIPGCCKGKAHDADHLGYAGRRVLVSRKWSGKTLADHRADRQQWLLATLGVSATDPARYAWEPVARATRTTWTTPGGFCMLSRIEPDGKPCFAKRDKELGWRQQNFRQLRGRQHEIRGALWGGQSHAVAI
jgi:hypothetical protein